MELTFVDAAPPDYEGIADLWFRAQAARRPGSFVTLRDARSRVAERALQNGACFVLAREGERTVGTMYVAPGRSDDGTGRPVRGLIHLSTIAVEPADWGRGIGTAIVRHAIDVARERSGRRIQLWTHADNLRAQRLFEKHGFTRGNRLKRELRGEWIVLYAREVALTSP